MKTIKYLYRSVLVALLLIGVSCTEDFEEINTDPNSPSKVSTAFLLANAELRAMSYVWNEWMNGRRGMQLSQYWSSNQYSDESRYAFRESISNTYWGFFYARVLADLQVIIDLNTNSPADFSGFGATENQIAVARILKVWMYQIMTDHWGDIPYTEALKQAEIPAPAYDTQEFIYNDLLKELDEALAQMNTSALGPQGDVIYGGNMSSWRTFANSLKLRVAMRMADVSPAVASSAVSAAVNAGVMTSNADNAIFQYGGGAPSNNPLNEDAKTRNDFAASDIMVNHLQSLGDPRLAFYAEPTLTSVAAGNPEYIGEEYGLPEDVAANTFDDNISQRDPRILEATAPGVFMQYAEVEFFLAEAVERGFISGNAADHYAKGITASMEYWNDGSLTATDIADYIAKPEVDYATLTAGGMTFREVIGQQKWVALYMQGLESWAEYRRLDFGILKDLGSTNVLEGDGTIPDRIVYPNEEQLLNTEKYEEAVSRQGADQVTTKLWWDVN